jgi:predicted nucleic acid-binding protein
VRTATIAVIRTLLQALGMSRRNRGSCWAADRVDAGRLRRDRDAIIAGVAWFGDATVVTRNPRDFEVQGVPVLAYD